MAKAIEYYEKAAQMNDPDALINIGWVIIFKSCECFLGFYWKQETTFFIKILEK